MRAWKIKQLHFCTYAIHKHQKFTSNMPFKIHSVSDSGKDEIDTSEKKIQRIKWHCLQAV